MQTIVQDIRYSIRSLMRARAFAFAAILTLALWIGANSTIFSIVNAVLLRPLPYPDSDPLVSIGSEWIGFHHSDVSIPEYLDYKEQASAFDSIAAYSTFGAVPAWHAARRDSHDALRESGRTTASVSSIRTKRFLVVAEIALAMMLLNAGAIVLLSFRNLVAVE